MYPNTFTSLPANAPTGIRNVWIVPADFEVPGSWQFVGTLDHAFTDTMAVNVNVLYSRSWSKEMAFDTQPAVR